MALNNKEKPSFGLQKTQPCSFILIEREAIHSIYKPSSSLGLDYFAEVQLGLLTDNRYY